MVEDETENGRKWIPYDAMGDFSFMFAKKEKYKEEQNSTEDQKNR